MVCKRRLMTPIPEKSHAWQIHRNMPSQSLLLVLDDERSAVGKSVGSSSLTLSSPAFAVEIMTMQRNRESMIRNSRPLTRSRFTK